MALQQLCRAYILGHGFGPLGRTNITMNSSSVYLLDLARLSVLRRSFEHLAAPQELEEPAGASEVEIARARSATLAQAAEQQAKLASVDQQIDQKRAEVQSVTAAIDLLPSDTSWLFEPTTGVHQFGGGSRAVL